MTNIHEKSKGAELDFVRSELSEDIRALSFAFSQDGLKNPGNVYLLEQMLRHRLASFPRNIQDRVIGEYLLEFRNILKNDPATKTIGRIKVKVYAPEEEIDAALKRVAKLEQVADYPLITDSLDKEGFKEEIDKTLETLGVVKERE